MNYLTNLPDEKIMEICEVMDNETLSSFVQTNTKFYNVCQETLNRRFEQLSIEEKQDILVRKMEKIMDKIYDGEKLNKEEIDFATPYVIKGSTIKSYFEEKLDDKDLDLEQKDRYEKLFNTANDNWLNEEWDVKEIFPLITTQEMEDMIYDDDSSKLDFNFYSQSLQLLQATYYIKGETEAMEIRAKIIDEEDN